MITYVATLYCTMLAFPQFWRIETLEFGMGVSSTDLIAMPRVKLRRGVYEPHFLHWMTMGYQYS